MLVHCNKCNLDLPSSEFYFDKRRNTPRTPCKKCSNVQKRFRRKENYINGYITKSSLEHNYRTVGVPEELKETILSMILLNREIKKQSDPHVIIFHEEKYFLLCRICGTLESLKLPISVTDLETVTKLFKDNHVHK